LRLQHHVVIMSSIAEREEMKWGSLLIGVNQANGAGIFIQNNKFWDFERALAKSRSAWMNAELLNEFRTGRNASIFKRIPETTPSKSKI